MKFATSDFFSKCALIRRKLRIWSLLRKIFLMEFDQHNYAYAMAVKYYENS